MSQAELVKQCKVKTGIVRRLHKEVDHYRKEEQHEQARVDKMKAAGADKFDLKQAVSTVLRDGPRAAFRSNRSALPSPPIHYRCGMQETVLQESTMMIPQTLQRLGTAFADLESYLAENQKDIAGTEELKAAKEMLELAEPSGKA